MKNGTQRNIDLLVETKNQCTENLNDSVQALLIAINSKNRDRKTIDDLAKNIKNWMNSYCLWINRSVDDLLTSIDCTEDK